MHVAVQRCNWPVKGRYLLAFVAYLGAEIQRESRLSGVCFAEMTLSKTYRVVRSILEASLVNHTAFYFILF